MADKKTGIDRRTVLKTGALLAGAASLSGCERIVSEVSDRLGLAIPEQLEASRSKEIDPFFHLLSRAAYGPWPGDLEAARSLGYEEWIEQQLEPDKIDDRACELRASRFETVHLDGATCFEYKKPVLEQELMRHALVESVYSKRQLLQVMTEFWTDHLNIYIDKGDCVYFKPQDDRLVVRRHALGNFKELIAASAKSPAMLVYLDGKENRKRTQEEIPNENYARELLELHTLGVHGGYTQQDVFEAARCLTGWGIHSGWQNGKVYFDKALHDQGEKVVLGETIAASGNERDLDDLVEIVCNHPATADHIALKMVRRFVADDPPPRLCRRVARSFNESGGDIKTMVRTILTSDEFKSARGNKLKRPYQFIASSLRLIGADTYAHKELMDYLVRMGQSPYQYPTPDGYPDRPRPWLGALLWRWNFALALASNMVPGASVSLEKITRSLAEGRAGSHSQSQDQLDANSSVTASELMPYFIGRLATRDELSALNDVQIHAGKGGKDERPDSLLVGLILASPAFQRC